MPQKLLEKKKILDDVIKVIGQHNWMYQTSSDHKFAKTRQESWSETAYLSLSTWTTHRNIYSSNPLFETITILRTYSYYSWPSITEVFCHEFKCLVIAKLTFRILDSDVRKFLQGLQIIKTKWSYLFFFHGNWVFSFLANSSLRFWFFSSHGNDHHVKTMDFFHALALVSLEKYPGIKLD